VKTNIGQISETEFKKALGERYLSYALSTIMSRSLPDVRDGLKPVHRRLLYAMHQLHLNPQSGYKKCARVVGDVIGKFHPHGDVAVYDALVRLAQYFAVRYPLVDGQGNFGNIDGDNAAAMRYTEARLTSVAQFLLQGIDQESVDFRATYDGENDEPLVLPAAFPNLLANGSSGIAVGMATNIPPHNVAELCDALCYLIDHKNVAVSDLLKFVQGPDFPTGGIIVESAAVIQQAYETGRGSLRVRARWEVEKLGNGQYQIIVVEIPYQVPKARLIEKVADLLAVKKLPLLSDIRDESTDLIRIVLEPKNRTVDPEILMESLFRTTDLETRFSLNMNVLDGRGIPGVLNLTQLLEEFLCHRLVVLRRVSEFRLGQISNRLDTLKGYLVAYLNLDEVIHIIRESEKPKEELMARWSLAPSQAEAILNMRLRALRKLEEIEIRRETDLLTKEEEGLKKLLDSPDKQKKVLRQQIQALKENFPLSDGLGARRTTFAPPPQAVVISLENFIEKEPVTVIYSEKGWIRALKGHGLTTEDIKYKEGDGPKYSLMAQTTDRLVLFASNGRFFTIGVDKLPRGRGQGEPVRLMMDLPQEEEIVTIFLDSVKEQEENPLLLVASSEGKGFVVKREDVIAQTRAGKQILNLSKGAKAAVCIPVTGDSVAVMGNNRKLLIFKREELPQMTRGQGVALQKFRGASLSDIKTFTLGEGLTWDGGAGRTRCEKDLQPWMGKRGGVGRFPPIGFPRTNRFSSP
jgi:topoisomerase-4 subunit A